MFRANSEDVVAFGLLNKKAYCLIYKMKFSYNYIRDITQIVFFFSFSCFLRVNKTQKQ